MQNTYLYKNISWVDLHSPSRSELKEVMKRFPIHPHVAEELMAPTLHPKVDVYKDTLYLILHFPAIKHTHSNEHNQEVDFLIGKNFLLTAHYDTIDAIHKFSKEFEVHSIVDKSIATKHAGYVFSYLIKKLYRSITHELEYIHASLNKIERHIFEGKEKDMVHALSEVSRAILDIKQILRDHDEILARLDEPMRKLFGPTYGGELKTVVRHYKDVMEIIHGEQEYLAELRDTNNSLVSTKQNEIMKILTIMAFVTFPLSLLAAIFGMNTNTLPLTGFAGDFWIIIGIMAALMASFFAYFKYKKWL